MSAELIQMVLAEEAQVENGTLANAPYLAVKIADIVDERLNVAKEGLLDIARIFDGWAPANIARRTLARLETRDGGPSHDCLTETKREAAPPGAPPAMKAAEAHADRLTLAAQAAREALEGQLREAEFDNTDDEPWPTIRKALASLTAVLGEKK